MSDCGLLLGCGKVDLHCHILPERWPDLKEVSFSGTWMSSRKNLMFLALWLWRMDSTGPPLPRQSQNDERWSVV